MTCPSCLKRADAAYRRWTEVTGREMSKDKKDTYITWILLSIRWSCRTRPGPRRASSCEPLEQ